MYSLPYYQMKTTKLLACFLLSVLVVGCSTLVAPKAPVAIKNPSGGYYSTDQLKSDRDSYSSSVTNSEFDKAMLIRDRMLWSLISDVDYSYYTFRNDFQKNRASMRTFSDMSKLGMASAATVMGGSAVLSGAIAALQGSELSIDKNFFGEKATEAIFQTMDALREQQMALIQKKVAAKPPAYSFEEAYNDALRLFNAGTIPSALQFMSAQAGQKQIEAKDSQERAIDYRVTATLPPADRQSLDKKIKIRNLFDSWLKDINANKAKIEKVVGPADEKQSLEDKLTEKLRETRTLEQINALFENLKEKNLLEEK